MSKKSSTPPKPSPGSTTFNKECPICLTDDKEDMWKLNCGHCSHLGCLKGMNKLDCPICRAEMTNLPIEIKQTIEKNKDDYQREQYAEHDRMFRRMMEEEGRIPTARISIEAEVQMALQYLISLGIPQSRIPAINMEIYSGPPPPQGAIYQSIVSNSIALIQQELDQNLVEEDEEDDNEESYSEDDSQEETVELRNLRPFTFSQFLGALAGASMLSSLRR